MKKIIFDPRYKALKSMKDKKQVCGAPTSPHLHATRLQGSHTTLTHHANTQVFSDYTSFAEEKEKKDKKEKSGAAKDLFLTVLREHDKIDRDTRFRQVASAIAACFYTTQCHLVVIAMIISFCVLSRFVVVVCMCPITLLAYSLANKVSSCQGGISSSTSSSTSTSRD